MQFCFGDIINELCVVQGLSAESIYKGAPNLKLCRSLILFVEAKLRPKPNIWHNHLKGSHPGDFWGLKYKVKLT